jgi:hypothetical protein
VSKADRSRNTRTHLQRPRLAPQQCRRDRPDALGRVPPREHGLPQRGMHYVLHPPRVGVCIVERRELFADRAAMGPGACAGFRDDAVAGGTEDREEIGWEEIWDQDVALVVVGRLEERLGDAHRIGGQVEEVTGILTGGHMTRSHAHGRLTGPAPPESSRVLYIKQRQN